MIVVHQNVIGDMGLRFELGSFDLHKTFNAIFCSNLHHQLERSRHFKLHTKKLIFIILQTYFNYWLFHPHQTIYKYMKWLNCPLLSNFFAFKIDIFRTDCPIKFCLYPIANTSEKWPFNRVSLLKQQHMNRPQKLLKSRLFYILQFGAVWPKSHTGIRLHNLESILYGQKREHWPLRSVATQLMILRWPPRRTA